MYDEEDKCGGLLSNMTLTIGSRVMVRTNFDVQKGVVNGSLGTVIGFKWPFLRREPLNDGDLPDAVIVDLDGIGPTQIDTITRNFDSKKGLIISRRMVPLILSWAVSIHKTQGITLEKEVIDLDCFDYGMEYVAFSRLKSLNGLALSSINYKRFINNNITSPNALIEINYLREQNGIKDLIPINNSKINKKKSNLANKILLKNHFNH